MWKTFIAFRYFSSKNNNSFTNFATNISMLTQIFANAILILILSLFKGYYYEITQKLINNKGHIKILNTSHFSKNQIKNKIHLKNRECLDSPALIIENNINYPIEISANSETLTTANEKIEITINENIAKLFKYKINDKILILIPVTSEAPIYIEPTIIECIITNIEKNNKEIQMNLKKLQEILGINDKISSIECTCDSIKNVKDNKLLLKKNLQDFIILDWEELNENVMKMINTEKNIVTIIVFLLLFLLFLIAMLAIGLFIYSKKNEIKILKLLKAKKSNIISIFIQYSLIISSFNVVLGSFLGVFLSKNINSIVNFIEKTFNIIIFNKELFLLQSIPTILSLTDITLIAACSIISSLLGAIILSKKIFYIDIF